MKTPVSPVKAIPIQRWSFEGRQGRLVRGFVFTLEKAGPWRMGGPKERQQHLRTSRSKLSFVSFRMFSNLSKIQIILLLYSAGTWHMLIIKKIQAAPGVTFQDAPGWLKCFQARTSTFKFVDVPDLPRVQVKFNVWTSLMSWLYHIHGNTWEHQI